MIASTVDPDSRALVVSAAVYGVQQYLSLQRFVGISAYAFGLRSDSFYLGGSSCLNHLLSTVL
jgi:hypothetical protein